MAKKYTKARFWKCALQVNPFDYIEYRGKDHGLSEDEYNSELLRFCEEENVKVIGLASHGNVDGVDAIRDLMNQHNVVVFPGFEISSSEKVHFVCLFPENTTKDQLNRFLGALGLTNPSDGVWPSNLGGNDLLAKVNELEGFAYAAHCNETSGILDRSLNHVWKNPLLKAAQIPGTLDDLMDDEVGYHQILLNKTPEYQRDRPIAVINAKDVAKPGDIHNPKTSCLIKMTKPCFTSFIQAFLDPESRVRLNSEIPDKYYSCIESIKFTGGYLDGLEIEFSEHLNAVIGGRGTGKSTLLECIRYALGFQPVGQNAKRQHDDIVKENLGKEKGLIELKIRSSAMSGRRFVVSRRYGESTFVRDENGNPSSFTPQDLLPQIEIYGQNEIYEIAQDPQQQLILLKRFLDVDNQLFEGRLAEIEKELEYNRNTILKAKERLAEIEDEVGQLPKLREQVKQFKEIDLEKKLAIVPKQENEKYLSLCVNEKFHALTDGLKNFRKCLPSTDFLEDKEIKELPHAKYLIEIRNELDKMIEFFGEILPQIDDEVKSTEQEVLKHQMELTSAIKHDDEELKEAFKEIPSCEGQSGEEIGEKFRSLLSIIEKIRPMEDQLPKLEAEVEDLQNSRISLLGKLSEVRAQRSAHLQRALKSLNHKLLGKLKLTVLPESDRHNLVMFLKDCNLENIGDKRLAWIKTAEDFSPVKLAEIIRNGKDALINTNWEITSSVADALVRLPLSKILEMEELELSDTITIELNVAHEGRVVYRPLSKLSTGQQCTAILHMLLLDNLDPLIMDQPEDNLDNAFIADRIVNELRSAKISRQFLFATHNANIPVFGDAEWIGVFDAEENYACIPKNAQGAIDLPQVQQKTAAILEGGRTAFIQRKEKYGF